MNATRDLYQPYLPGGVPYSYFSYNGGVTRPAIRAYVRHMADPILEPEPTRSELRLVCEYCAYFINAPGWIWPRYDLEMLRSAIERITCALELANWLYACSSIGIDPL
jgi:hypothetical protein